MNIIHDKDKRKMQHLRLFSDFNGAILNVHILNNLPALFK